MKTVKKYWKNAWLGISIIMLTVAFIFIISLKKVENEKKD